jgi:RNA polymerase sigma-70 factor (ECF subfamily)
MTDDIWQTFSSALKKFIITKVSDNDTANDILQNVFLKIHENIHSLKDTSKLESWIYQICRNAINDYYRTKQKKKTLEVIHLDENIDNDNYRNFASCLKPFILKLSKNDQDILSKISFENYSQKDYAEKHNLNYSTVKSRLQRARKKLKNLFINCCETKSDSYGNIISHKSAKCLC